MDKLKLSLIKQRIESAEKSIISAKKLLEDVTSGISSEKGVSLKDRAKGLVMTEKGRIVEGVFNGENMIGPDDREYPVPANYASKSKLVEGDILKLTISDDGSFVYKQIGPIDRKKIIGQLGKDENGSFAAVVKNKRYRVLLASVTYFQAEEGDEVTIVVPRDQDSEWAAIENVIKAGSIKTNKEKIKKKKEEAIDDLATAAEDTTVDELDKLDEINGLN
ncbi:MAG: 50S ribosomal protein L7/L12 [uncultured bacterium]|nr:MAG: 50S ribosomal protein L7/L12 [uncultured bacterium]